jgi:hypothetical protein
MPSRNPRRAVTAKHAQAKIPRPQTLLSSDCNRRPRMLDHSRRLDRHSRQKSVRVRDAIDAASGVNFFSV